MVATWKPHDKQGRLTKRSDLPDSVFAYPEQRKEPMTNASHVRNALARFAQVEGVSNAQRASAFANIKKAAQHFGVDVSEKDWQELGSSPSSGSAKATRKKAAASKQTSTRSQRSTSKKTAARKKTAAPKAAASKGAPLKRRTPKASPKRARASAAA